MNKRKVIINREKKKGSIISRIKYLDSSNMVKITIFPIDLMIQKENSFRLNLFNTANKYFNFPSFKSTYVELKLHGGCSSAGQSTWLWPRRPWVQVPSLTQKISGYSVVRLTRLLWEQEIGSSNLSTPTLEVPILLKIWGFSFVVVSLKRSKNNNYNCNYNSSLKP